MHVPTKLTRVYFIVKWISVDNFNANEAAEIIDVFSKCSYYHEN